MRSIVLVVVFAGFVLASCRSSNLRDCPSSALGTEQDVRNAVTQFLGLGPAGTQSMDFWISRHGCEWSVTITKRGAPPSSEISLVVDAEGIVSLDL